MKSVFNKDKGLDATKQSIFFNKDKGLDNDNLCFLQV